MHFPDEILLEVIQYLDKANLKKARLISKAWSCCAAQQLFTKIFISPSKLNLEVFKAISQHPLLSTCV